MAVRLPTPGASVVDLTCNLEKPTSFDEIKACIKFASESPEYAGNMDYTED